MQATEDGDRKESERGSQAINRALSILGLFTVERPNMSLTDICAATGLTMPTAHRMVRTLLTREYLVQVADTGRYSLGPMLLNVAQVVLQTSAPGGLIVAAMPHLETLRNVTEETVGLHVLGPSGRLCVAEVPSLHAMRMMSGVGSLLPVYAGAAGKALLSAMSPEARSALLDRQQIVALTPKTMVDRNALEAELDEVAGQGYAISLGETVDGAGAVAAPIRGVSQQVVGAINITGPLTRWTEARMRAVVPDLIAATGKLEQSLGRSPVG